MKKMVAFVLATVLAGCGAGGGSLPELIPTGVPAGAGMGRVVWTVSLPELGLATSRAYETHRLEADLTGPAGQAVSRVANFDASGSATLEITLEVGEWRLDQLVVKEGDTPLFVNSGPVDFTVVAGQSTNVNVTLVPATGTATFVVHLSEPWTSQSGDLVSYSGSELKRGGQHRFRWTAPTGVDSARLYIDLAKPDLLILGDIQAAADVEILEVTGGFATPLYATYSWTGGEDSRISQIVASPGTVVSFKVNKLYPFAPPGQEPEGGFNRLTFRSTALTDGQPSNRVEGELGIID